MAIVDENGHANLYVSGLPRGMTEEQFQELFVGAGGNIISCKCVPEKRYGFVKYARVSEAQAVIDAMNGYDHNGTILVVKFAHADDLKGAGSTLSEFPDRQMQNHLAGWGAAPAMPDLMGQVGGDDMLSAMRGQIAALAPDSVHVKGLPKDVTEEMIHGALSNYGMVLQVQLVRFQEGSSAFLRMGSGEMALWLVENLNNNIPQGLGTPVQVTFADEAQMMKNASKTVRFSPYGNGSSGGGGGEKVPLDKALDCVKSALGGRKAAGIGGEDASLTVKDLPGIADDIYLYKVFAPFGALESVAVKRDPGGAWAVAFVRYLSADGAKRAVQALNGCALPDGAMLKVSIKGQK